MPTLLTEHGQFEVASPVLAGGMIATATGWTLKSEGMCRGEVCVPLPAGMAQDDRIDVAAFWRHIGNPLVSDDAGETIVLGAGAEERSEALAGLLAPDFILPDLAGVPHRLSDLRGRKILLVTWASWCGCRFDLPIWQDLFDSLAGEKFMVVAVAEESRGAGQARPWIEQAAPAYWSLIDTDHRVAALYGMVNVPQAVWIDEAGRIVRPPETAGSTDHFRRMDPVTRTMSPEHRAERDAARAAYMDAVRDWVRTGRHALDADAARRKLPRITPEIARAHAHFRLGVWLRARGRIEEADRHLAEASRLHPESWNMWRQAADLDEVGKASGPAFRARVAALGDRPYYPPPEIAAGPPPI